MNFLYRLKEYMRGRNGVDNLSIALVVVAMIISFIVNLCGIRAIAWQRIIVYAILGVATFRILSRDISKRANENEKFMSIINRFRKNKSGNYYQPYQTQFTQKPKKDKKNYKYFKCNNCKAQLRVPKGKGKINVTCPKCKTKFSAKS